MNKQMFVDETEVPSQLFLLTGVILKLEDVMPFSEAWWKLLPKGQERKKRQHNSPLAKALYTQSLPYIHAVYEVAIPIKPYKEVLARLKERVDFCNRIHQDASFYTPLELKALRRWSYRNMACIACISLFEQHQVEFGSIALNLDEPVDITFDQFRDTAFQDQIREGFEIHRETVPPEQRAVMGRPPQFADSKDCPPIQFADRWGWWRQKVSRPEKLFDGARNPTPWGGDVKLRSTAWTREDMEATFKKKLDLWIDSCPRVIRPKPSIYLPSHLIEKP